MPKPFDFYTWGGANILAERIKRFWLARGRSVNVRVEPIPFANAKLPKVFGVQSDMVGGRPREVAT